MCSQPQEKVQPENQTKARPETRNFGGHEHFSAYQKWFRELYSDPARPIYDVLGRRVLFDQEPLLDDCAHVCYGGINGRPYNPDCWYPQRAERIAWIERALTAPKKIHPDENYSDRHKYLLFLPPDEGTEQENEFFCVIVRVLGSKTVAFLTAYDISQATFDKYGNVGPRIYPPPTPKRKKR